MFQNLQNLGWGLVSFALIIGMGSIILHNFGGAVATCKFGSLDVYNSTLNLCHEIGNSSNSTTPAGSGWVNIDYLITELGTTGLAGWTPAIVAISVGMLIFGAFLIGGGRGGRKY